MPVHTYNKGINPPLFTLYYIVPYNTYYSPALTYIYNVSFFKNSSQYICTFNLLNILLYGINDTLTIKTDTMNKVTFELPDDLLSNLNQLND